MQSNRIRLISVTALAVAAVSSASALQIVLVPNATLSGNTAALAAFQRAAAHWEGAFSDNVTVTINAGLANLGTTGIIGQTGSSMYSNTYSNVRSAMIADSAPYADNAIVNSLPSSFPTVNSTSGFNTSTIQMTTANAKALGFSTGAGADATITFNSQFSFDYDRSNGQTTNTEDFETVAEHEIGHALGFISGADGNGSVTLSTLDLFRFATAPTTAAEFAANAREMRKGQAATFSDTVSNYRMSTAGNDNGYTYQASHWRADEISGQFIGIMDPSIAFGQFYDYTDADLRAFDLIGWNVNRVQATPEPATLAALGLGTLAVLRRRKRSA